MLHYNLFGVTNATATIVLLHGFCESSSIWEVFAHRLTGLCASYQVITIDLAGFGKSPLLTTTPSIALYAQQVHEVLQYLEVKNYVLIGHSLGGYVTLSYAEQFPMCLQGIGLFNSTALADTPEKKEHRNKIIGALQTYGAEAFIKNFYHNLFSPLHTTKFETQIATLLVEGKNFATETLVAATKAMRDRKDQKLLLQQLTLPVLFVIGQEDPIIPLASMYEQIGLPKDATIHLSAQHGHMGMLEQPIKTLHAVHSFVTYCTSI